MPQQPSSLSDKVENFVKGILRFTSRFSRTCYRVVGKPGTFNIGLGRLLRQKKIVPPLTFLLVGCFLYSIIIDTYPAGWQVYFDWIWFDEEISKKINERGADLFSLTSIARSGLPTFMTFVLLAYFVAFLYSGTRWMRGRAFATAIYAFGFHGTAFSLACLLPIFSANTLDDKITDSFLGGLWTYGVYSLVIAIIVGLAFVAFVSPIFALTFSVHSRDARFGLKRPIVRFFLSIPIFILSIFLATEIGSLPARFNVSLKTSPKVNYQVMASPKLFGGAQGDISRAELRILLHNRTQDLAYIDADDELLSVTIRLPDGTEASFKKYPVTRIFDQNRNSMSVLPILPGQARLVILESVWELDELVGKLENTDEDGWYYSNKIKVTLDYDIVTGADFDGDLEYEIVGPTVLPLP